MSIATVITDSAIIAKRNLIKIKRIPDLLVFTTLQPIMFVVLFAYVFGGAIDQEGGGAAYREFLIAGIFAQTVIFGASITGYGLAEDVRKGIIDRFRSLPMAQPAVLIGRTFSDVVGNVLVLIVMAVTGFVVGWRIRTSFAEAMLGFLLLLVFAYAVSWVFAWVGLLVPSPEVVNNASFIILFPLTFIANTFVPIDTLPPPLQVFAEWNPVSSVTLAARQHFGNPDPNPDAEEPTSWALQNPDLYTMIWVVILLVVFIPLASALYRRAGSR